MKVHEKYKTPIDKQLGEAICIARAGGMESTSVMNLKDEYTRCIIPEIQIQGLGNRGRNEAKIPRDQGEPNDQVKIQIAKRPRLTQQKTQRRHNPHIHTSPQHLTKTPEAFKKVYTKNPSQVYCQVRHHYRPNVGSNQLDLDCSSEII